MKVLKNKNFKTSRNRRLKRKYKYKKVLADLGQLERNLDKERYWVKFLERNEKRRQKLIKKQKYKWKGLAMDAKEREEFRRR